MPVSGQPQCTGWPANVAAGPLPASFDAVAVLRCVTSVQTIPGKGEWQVAVLERAEGDLSALTGALHRPPGRMIPGTICPDFVIIPPKIVLVGADGSMVSPKVPVNGCGHTQQQVTAALAALHWKTVSVRPLFQLKTPQEVSPKP
jgi:hypothetical protein